MSKENNSSDEELKRILEEEHGFVFQNPLHTEAPEPRIEYIGQQSREGVDVIRNYLLDMYIIRDTFENDHSARRNFFKEFEARYGTSFFKRRSKLKGNNNLAVLVRADIIGSNVRRRNDGVYKNLRDVLQSNRTMFSDEICSDMNQYNEMSFEERVDFVRRLDSAAYMFLETLSR
jgi:hypothetical protein